MKPSNERSDAGQHKSECGPLRTFVCDRALLATGWAEEVVLAVDEQGMIASVETSAEIATRKVTEGALTDRQGLIVERLRGTVVPGMANVHSHAHQRLMAGLAERSSPASLQAANDTFWTWREAMFSFVEHLSPDQLESAAEQAYIEMLEAGFTAVGEFQYLHNQPGGSPYDNPAELSLRCLEAARNTGVACTLLPVLYARGGFGGQALRGGQCRFATSVASVIGIVERLDAALAVRSEGQCQERLGLAPHSLRAVSVTDLRLAVSAFRSVHAAGPVHMHIAEQVAEVEDCLAQCGQRPVERLIEAMADSETPVDGSWCCIHSTHLTDSECSTLAATEAVVGLCPTTEANLGDGVFPARRFLEQGGSLAIGTDSQIRISVSEDLRQLETSQRLRDRERNVLAGGEGRSVGRTLFSAAAANGARALAQPMGVLEVGRRADFVVLDSDHDRLFGRTDDAVLDSWIFAGDNTCVRDVYVAGVKTVEQGRHVQRDRVAARFRATVQDFLG